MRIRTTRQAREIRAGIHLTRDPFLAQFIKYARPLTRRAYYRTKNRPPRGEQGLTRRAHNEGGSIVHQAINFTIKHGAGLYRLPGDRPLIHKGGKP